MSWIQMRQTGCSSFREIILLVSTDKSVYLLIFNRAYDRHE